MNIEWTNDLAVGFPDIDQQHQELFAKINLLLNACNQGKGKDTVGETIQFLADYVVYHFGCEEKLMQQFNYPDYSSHKAMHDQFVQRFVEVQNRFKSDGVSVMIVLAVNQMVVKWLNDHIRKVDKLLGAFLKEKQHL